MDDFVLKVILSFLIGGFYVAGIIWLSEKLGSRIGGAVAGLPSTILISLIFISITEGPTVAQTVVAIVPFMFFATLIYSLVFLKAVIRFKKLKRHLGVIIVATIVWFLVALIVKSLSHIPFFALATIALVGLFIFRYWFRNFPSTAPIKIPLPNNIHLLRFVTGGGVIAAAVIAARLLGPTWGGIVSSFPAMLGSILYFLNRSQGEVFLKGFLRRLPLGYISSLIFIILLYITITNLPIFLSFIIAMTGSLFYTFVLIASKRFTRKPLL